MTLIEDGTNKMKAAGRHEKPLQYIGPKEGTDVLSGFATTVRHFIVLAGQL